MFIWTMLFIVVNFISVIMLLYYSIKINIYFIVSQLICMITMIALMYSIFLMLIIGLKFTIGQH